MIGLGIDNSNRSMVVDHNKSKINLGNSRIDARSYNSNTE